VVASAQAQDSAGFSNLDTYGTLQAGGVVATVDGDANRNAGATLEWRMHGESAFHAGHPLVRVDASHLVGSLFWLDPGHAYDVRVSVSDPDGVGTTPVRSATLTTRAEAATFTPLRTLHVAPNGSDANDGTTPATALRTLQRAAELSRPGDLVSIGAGIYREDVRVTTPGTPGQPIVFRGETGAILDGADADIDAGVAWTNAGNGVWSHVTGFATGHVVSDQGRLFRYDNLAALRSLAAGAPGGFLFDGATLWLKFSDGSAPAQRQLHVARLDEGMYLDGVAHVRIENLEIRHYGSDAYGKGVYLRHADDVIVSGNRIHDIGSAGIWVKGGERNLVEGNDVGDTSIANWPWALTHDSSAQNSAIALTDNVGRGNVIRRNNVHGTYDGLHPCANAAAPSGFSNETDVYENAIADIADDAIEAEGMCANVRLWNNHIRDALMAFAIAPARIGPVWIVRNTAWNLGSTHSAQVDGQVSSAIKINSGESAPLGPTLIYHNTFVSTVANTDALALMTPGSGNMLTSRNNVFAATRLALRKDNAIAADFDYDDLYTSNGLSFARWYGVNFPTLGALQAVIATEPHARSASPLLNDPARGDFTPQTGSALVDGGISIAGIDDGYTGTAPDLGAVELDGTIFDDGFD
jgi:parallel beta-helix repeat protein